MAGERDGRDEDERGEPRADDKLAAEPFSYRASNDGKVFISFHGRQVMIVKGEEAAHLLDKLTRADARGVQFALAKITGNFKRGNEKLAKSRER